MSALRSRMAFSRPGEARHVERKNGQVVSYVLKAQADPFISLRVGFVSVYLHEE